MIAMYHDSEPWELQPHYLTNRQYEPLHCLNDVQATLMLVTLITTCY